jgi:GntR family transcriptional regulator/MocR family aminotransferase
LLDPGDRVLVEDPCYSIARDIFIAAGGIPVPIAVDRDGMQTGALPRLAAGARLAYVTPSHQFPLGSIMSVSRRQDLLAWARDHDGYVIEDDYDSEFRYDGRPVETMRMLDTADRVIYVGTLSKTLSPALRLGYIVASPALCAGFAAVKRLADRHTAELLQRAAAALIANGTYERHVRRLRRRNADRRNALLAAFRAHLGERVSVAGAAAGLHVVVWFTGLAHTEEAGLIAAAAAAGVGIYPIGPHCHTRGERPDLACAGAILGYASLNETQIDHGVRRLAGVLTAFAPHSNWK